MDRGISRFKLCDSRFYPYLNEVVDRLPEEVKEEVLNNETLQILADENFHEMGVLRYAFENPVNNLVCLNTKILNQPKHKLIYTIAHEIAGYICGQKGSKFDEKETEKMLIDWGFENEVEAVRYDRAIAETEGYKIGHEWAKRQDKEYLWQHFGLYFDEWDEKGLGKMSSERFEMLHTQACASSILGDMTQPKKQTRFESDTDSIVGSLSLDESMIAGIMAAVKEGKFHDLSSAINGATSQG